jgi:hypothetical protein
MRSFEHNQRKLETLRIFQNVYPDWLRPEAYAWKIGKLPARAGYSYLKKLWGWGLLERSEKPVRYRITQRGQRRLMWLQTQS